MEETINNLIKDENIMKEKVIEIEHLVSYLMSRLVIGRVVILETKGNWKPDNSFFEYVNFTLPCRSDCPIKYGEPRECHLNLDVHTLSMDFNIPIVNPNLTIVEADPFFLMLKEQNQTCKIEYHGPANPRLSPLEDCIHAVDIGKITTGRIFFPHSRKCQTQKSLSNEKEWLSLRNCYQSRENDEISFIQIKAYQNKLYIYCPALNFTIGQTRDVKCPNRVFTLPLKVAFTLNVVTYQGKTMNFLYNKQERTH